MNSKVQLFGGCKPNETRGYNGKGALDHTKAKSRIEARKDITPADAVTEKSFRKFDFQLCCVKPEDSRTDST